jgi:hypothetical protein
MFPNLSEKDKKQKHMQLSSYARSTYEKKTETKDKQNNHSFRVQSTVELIKILP